MISCLRAKIYVNKSHEKNADSVCASAQKTDISYFVNLISVRVWKDYSGWYSGFRLSGATGGKISADIRADSTSTLNRSLCRGDSRQRRSLWATHKSPFNSSAVYSHPPASLPTYPHPAHMRDNPLVQQKIEELMTRGHCGCRMMAGVTDRLVFLLYCQVSNDWDFPQF